MTDVNNAAVPSPVAQVVPESATNVPEKVQFDGWDDKGNPIVTKKSEVPAKQESAPADPPKEAKPEPEGETAAESEAAPKQQEKRGKKTAEDRISELVAERNQERNERKALEERLRKLETAAQPSSKDAKTDAKPEQPKRPNPFTWSGTPEEYEKALDAYETHLREIAARDALEQHSKREQAKELQGKLDDARKRYADADTRILPAAEKISQDQQIPAAVRQIIEESPVLTDLLYTLNDGESLSEFMQLAKSQPGQAIRKVALMERLIQDELSGKAKAEAKAEPETPVETKPRAPKPPSEVGGRSASAEDGLVAAARANSFRDFESEMNRRLQARK